MRVSQHRITRVTVHNYYSVWEYISEWDLTSIWH